MPAHYKIHTVQFHADSQGGAVNLPGITSQALELNPELVAEITAGNSSPDHVAFTAARVMHRLSTRSIATMLDICGAKGLAADSETNPGVTAYLQRFDNLGQPASGSVHRSLNFPLCLAYPISLTCEHRGDATLEIGIAIVQKTSHAIVILSDTAALPSITVTPQRFTLGPMDIGGQTLSSYRSFRLDFGNNVVSSGVQSDVYDTLIEEATHSPTLTIQGIDPTWFAAAAVPVGGLAATHANTLCYLRKRTQDGNHFVGDATEEHIEITLAGLSAIDNPVAGGQVTRPSETSLVVTAAIDGSGNDPVIIDTTAALP